MAAGWNALESEIARWRDAGRSVEFWLRDDDAVRPTKALERLLALAGNAGVPVALAVIPALAEPGLFAMLPASADILQHGSDHSNRAIAGEKKTEYPPGEASQAALKRLAEGRRQLAWLAGGRLLAVLAPPWNRIPAEVVAQLANCGIHGVSRYGPRKRLLAAPGVVEVNTHVDLINWKRDRGFVGAEQALLLAAQHLAARRNESADRDEPTGWLTHHAVHDEAAWAFLAELFARFGPRQGVLWRPARELFSLR